MYKMITVDASKKVLPTKLLPELSPFVEAMIRKPLIEFPNFTDAMAMMDNIPGLRDFYEKIICTTIDNSVDVFQTTTDQYKNPKWDEYRDCRIPSSKAYEVFKGTKVHTRRNYWRNRPKDNANFRHGRNTEPFGKQKYQTLKPKHKVYPAGMYVDSF